MPMVRFFAATLVAILPVSAVTAMPLTDPIPAVIELGDVEVELTPIADGMIAPRTATFAPEIRNRLFVADQAGLVYSIDLVTRTRNVLLDIRDRTLTVPGTADERGLLGLAFHPDYENNGLFYTFSSEETNGPAGFAWDGPATETAHQSVLTEWRVDNPLNPGEVADPNSRREVFRIDQPSASNIGGSLAFDNLSRLLIGLGDGGFPSTAQDNSTVLGSVLRIYPNPALAPFVISIPSPYGDHHVPTQNPFSDNPDLLDEVFAYGHRNPHVSVRKDNGIRYAADIGGNGIQEVSYVNSRSNNSYPIKEGRFCVLEGGGVGPLADCQVLGLGHPIMQYDQDDGYAIVGGFAYSGSRLDFVGNYIFGDRNGRLFYQESGALIRELQVFANNPLPDAQLLGFGEDEDLELYVLTNDTGTLSGTTGQVFKITPLGTLALALKDWGTVMAEFYAERGYDAYGAEFIAYHSDNWLTAEHSRDPEQLSEAEDSLNFLTALINVARGRWGNPVLSDDLADRMIAATQNVIDSFGAPPPAQGGLLTMTSNDVERSFYLSLPSDYEATKGEKPLVIGIHGTGGSHSSWVGDDPLRPQSYNLLEVVGDDAIMVFPNALPNWNFGYDFQFFEDLIAELDALGVSYDRNQLFVLGHSNGAGMAAEIGCRYGDIVRAIGMSAGSMISNQCVGSVAVMQRHGRNDPIVAVNNAEVSHNFWTLYNGWDIDLSSPMSGAFSAWSCVNHSLLPIGSADYPVVWCLDDSYHPMPDGDTTAFWEFFSGLPIATPTTNPPAGGGNERVNSDADTTISFTLNYPDDIGNIVGGAITLYPASHCRGQFAAPLVFLNPTWYPGAIAPGSTVTYENVPVTYLYFGDFILPAEYKLQFSIYVEGGSRPIPTIGIDHDALIPITIPDTTTPIILQDALDVEVVAPFAGCP